MNKQLKKTLINSTRLLALAGMVSMSSSVYAWGLYLECEMGDIYYWDDGFMLTDITVTNYTGIDLSYWRTKIEFGDDVEIEEMWDATAYSSNGNIKVFQSDESNSDLDSGDVTSFALLGSYSGDWVEPECYIEPDSTND